MPVVRYTLDPKQPSETIPYQVDFATELMNSTESISTLSVNVYDSSGSDQAAMMDSYSESSGVVTVQVAAGSDGSQYWLRVEATTDEGNVYEADAQFSVTEVGYS